MLSVEAQGVPQYVFRPPFAQPSSRFPCSAPSGRRLAASLVMWLPHSSFPVLCVWTRCFMTAKTFHSHISLCESVEQGITYSKDGNKARGGASPWAGEPASLSYCEPLRGPLRPTSKAASSAAHIAHWPEFSVCHFNHNKHPLSTW